MAVAQHRVLESTEHGQSDAPRPSAGWTGLTVRLLFGAIWAVDARTGRGVRKCSIGEPAFVTPVFLDGRIYAAGFLGCVRAFGWREPAGKLPARARESPARPRDRRRALDHLPPLGVAAGRARS